MKQVHDLEALTVKLDQQIQLSVRFIQWFYQRGDAYEHNMQVLEAQLSKVANASTPSTRDAYDGQVRFVPRN